jgi:hypothetical protein
MVSKASELLPLPESPVTTTKTSRGSETVMSFKLCSRAPRTTILLSAIFVLPFARDKYTAPFGEAKGRSGIYKNFTTHRTPISSAPDPAPYN